MASCLLKTLMVPYARLVMLLRVFKGDMSVLPTRVRLIKQCEGVACGGTLLHMMPQGHGRVGPWWAKLVFMMGGNRWCQPYVVMHGIGGLLADYLCV